MNPLTVFLLFIVILAVACFLIYFFRRSFRPARSSQLSEIKENPDRFLNKRDPSHDENL